MAEDDLTNLDREERGTLMRVSPRRPAFWLLSHLKTSFVLSPLTSDLAMSGKDTPWLSSQNSAIFSSFSGS